MLAGAELLLLMLLSAWAVNGTGALACTRMTQPTDKQR